MSSTIKSKQIRGPSVSAKGSSIISDGTTTKWTSESTESLLLPSGNTSQRPTASAGSIRYNTQLTQLEVFDGTSWVNVVTGGSGGVMIGSNNLSEITNASTARDNLGLGNVNNTSDVNKPISTATQNALDLKLPTANPKYNGAITSESPSATYRNYWKVTSEPYARYTMILNSDNGLSLNWMNSTTGALGNPAWIMHAGGDFEIRSAVLGSTTRVGMGGSGTPPLQVSSLAGSHIGLGMRTDGTNGQAFCVMYKGGTGVTGSIADNNAGGVAYNTTSDYRLKNTTGPFENSLDIIKQSKVYSGTWYADPNADPEPMMLAHEIQEYMPRAVSGEKDETELIDVTDNDGNYLGQYPVPKHQQADYSKLVPLLFAGLKELTLKVEQLENEINILKN